MQWQTHEISNQVPELQHHNLFLSDTLLQDGLQHYKADWHTASLEQFGAELGMPETLLLGEQANRYLPELRTHDRTGKRIDVVDFHPSWHQLLGMLRSQGLQALPWSHPRAGAQVARAAGYYMQAQIESGSLCPTTMTFAAIPVLQKEPALFAQLREKLYATRHDPRDLPIPDKYAIMIGMGMTEKQGGSDVRTNTTLARPCGASGRGEAYLLTGHKWFFSAPMCDAHLVLARTEAGLSCFFVPRWKPDGTKNTILIQRLKDKLGNQSNSSSEVEFQDAYGIMIGTEGRGIPTIIEMANLTRLDCVIGSAALMRQALIQAIHHARHRSAFGRLLAEQPLMAHTLADLALESEAAGWLMLQLASVADGEESPLHQAWRRIMTPAAKFWVCKRAIEFTGECMEVMGGNGYVETAIMARLYREAPVNSIWEGSGNVMCLDVLRAIDRDPEGAQLLLADFATCGHAAVRQLVLELQVELLTPPETRELQARRLVQKLVLAAQSVLLIRHAPQDFAETFISSRLNTDSGRIYGSTIINDMNTCQKILNRAFPA